ncbi:hypothetical protein IFM89_012465 [Coptis chinensis]|uniref:Uncharacterized protein n=1 Tax=Coptis chinensis TaxID=261450 RepID=A0A835LVH3_9MAGN|nr:hypothetical protein IFM89_012465 [Coptis chinensis]
MIAATRDKINAIRANGRLIKKPNGLHLPISLPIPFRSLSRVKKRKNEGGTQSIYRRSLVKDEHYGFPKGVLGFIKGDLEEGLKKFQDLVDENPRDFWPYLCQIVFEDCHYLHSEDHQKRPVRGGAIANLIDEVGGAVVHIEGLSKAIPGKQQHAIHRQDCDLYQSKATLQSVLNPHFTPLIKPRSCFGILVGRKKVSDLLISVDVIGDASENIFVFVVAPCIWKGMA